MTGWAVLPFIFVQRTESIGLLIREAYMPGVAVHEDGHSEGWFKYERLKMYQDKYGRAIQANFAVIDTLKHEDKPFDNHSSKNISIPLNPGLLLTVLNDAHYRWNENYPAESTGRRRFSSTNRYGYQLFAFGASKK